MKYCEEIIKQIEEGLEAGLSQKSVCDYVGISEDAFYRWIKEHNEFNERIKKATSVKKKELLVKIEEAGAKNWQAYAWILERCYPDEYGMKTRQELSGVVGQPQTWKELMDMRGNGDETETGE